VEARRQAGQPEEEDHEEKEVEETVVDVGEKEAGFAPVRVVHHGRGHGCLAMRALQRRIGRAPWRAAVALLAVLAALAALAPGAAARYAMYVGGYDLMFDLAWPLAEYDGDGWRAVPGIGAARDQGGVWSIVEFEGYLTVGGPGLFLTDSGDELNVYQRREAGVWVPVGGGRAADVWELQVYQGRLYAGVGAVGVVGRLEVWDGATWSEVADVNPQAMCEYDGQLVLGGSFLAVNGELGYGNIASYDGATFAKLGQGLDNSVMALTVYNGDLIAAGRFELSGTGGTALNHVGRWNGTGQWYPLGTGLPGTANTVDALLQFGDLLVAGGTFAYNALGISNIAQWNGTAWAPMSQFETSNTVFALAAFEDRLYAGGFLSRFEGHLAEWNETAALWAYIAEIRDSVNTLFTHCRTNFSGDDCADCEGDRYGPACDVECAVCDAHGTCTPGPDGGCACDPGWDGVACTECAAGYFGPSCASCATACVRNGTEGNICYEGLGGNCTCGPGRTGERCDACLDDHYGDACTPCAACEAHGVCYPGRSGNCTCDAGWAGASCSACAAGHYGLDCAPCELCNGTCVEGGDGYCACAPGWAGPPACADCAPGFYGPACALTCAECNLHGVCTEGRDGNCTCHGARTGPACEACLPDHYGHDCTPCSVCMSGVCIPSVNGTCACFEHWGGDRCDRCADGWYGADCEYACADCDEHGECVPSTEPPTEEPGYCICDEGWAGPTCAECAPDYYGPRCGTYCPSHACTCTIDGNECQNGGVCNVTFSGSACSCVPGYLGAYCEVATSCRAANATCLNGGTCAPIAEDATGVRCYCADGYVGERCEDLAPRAAQLDIVTLIVVPAAVILACLVLRGLSIRFARAHDVDNADHGAPGVIVVSVFDFVSNILFVVTLWQSHEPFTPNLVPLLATVFMVVPFLANITLSSIFIMRQVRLVHEDDPEGYKWFRDQSNESAVAMAWVFGFLNVEALGILDSHAFGVRSFAAPWVNREAAAYYIKMASMAGILFEDVPQLLLQAYVTFSEPLNTYVLLAVMASSLSIMYSVVERVFVTWQRRVEGQPLWSWVFLPRSSTTGIDDDDDDDNDNDDSGAASDIDPGLVGEPPLPAANGGPEDVDTVAVA